MNGSSAVTMVFEASTTVGLHIKRLTREHFGSGQQLTVVCTASSIGSSHQRSSSAVKAVLDDGISSRQEQQQTGPLVNPLRPSTAVPTPAAGDKRRSPQTSTGQSLIITRKATYTHTHNSTSTTTPATSSLPRSHQVLLRHHAPARQKELFFLGVTMAIKRRSIRHDDDLLPIHKFGRIIIILCIYIRSRDESSRIYIRGNNLEINNEPCLPSSFWML